MPYTIKPAPHAAIGSLCECVFDALALAIRKDGRFTCDLTNCGKLIEVRSVRLVTPKPYCGQHPGPCELNGRKKRTTRFLEWDDWVAFHNVVNDVLDKLHVSADVFTRPMETVGTMYMRKADWGRRTEYDYELGVNNYGRTIQKWNLGTRDQFNAKRLYKEA